MMLSLLWSEGWAMADCLCGYRPVIWDTLADFFGSAGGGGEDLGPTGGGGGRGLPAMG